MLALSSYLDPARRFEGLVPDVQTEWVSWPDTCDQDVDRLPEFEWKQSEE